MNETINVVPLRHPDEIDDPLSDILRSGAQRLLARASRIAALVAAFLGFADAAFAQRPNEEQIAAIRQACRFLTRRRQAREVLAQTVQRLRAPVGTPAQWAM